MIRSGWPATAIVLLGATALVSTVFASDLDERVARLEREVGQQRAIAGERIFARACAACHGATGRGDGPAAADLDPPPRDLSSRRFRFRTTPTGALPLPDDLKRTIRRGLPGTAMSGYGDLFSERELDSLVAFVYALHGDPSPPDELQLSDRFDRVQPTATDGRAIYLISGCWTCHGVNGNGRGPSSATLTDELERPMRILDLRLDPFKGGRDLASVVRALRTGLNGAPMPSYDQAMMFAAEDYSIESVSPQRDVELSVGSAAYRLRTADREILRTFLDAAPSRERIAALDETAQTELRDTRLEALARYVLSLDQRHGFAYRLFREHPEAQARSE